ncbi:MAG: DUF3291 domain-containing protein [Saprospiraceae bacterium]|nr:DUF3291 domain-containing protein [Saprospiraceae bacterium]
MLYLAQLNIARLLKPIDHPQIKEFVENLEGINLLAETSPGFVWRLKSDSGYATDIDAFGDPLIIVNMSVWKSLDDLKNFVYQSHHVKIMRKRKQWFEKPKSHYMVLWWIPMGHIPTVEEAKQKLNYLSLHGESSEAFTFRKSFQK